ncbi:hypothetical protein GCM10011492_00450 [Flexivirga endophytica]|uniref:DUF3349 domain-containing protein n=1 Tax=Flexivirga endophytica TaxID=1849103 RepID=A0A916WN99_9MICO|nr:DUF3349 domain-containing protein [Flexivirga endophytica]GGB14699.1 hypothetical protein GCM10011492_00450 [Flexivirga endophytica]GHB65552.1 hypothetical protein GCM10008112_38050 [Flexivirga endophytica]
MAMATNMLTSVVDWLRKGYPEGIPPKDFPPLLALLQRTLQPADVQAVCAQLISDHPDGGISAESVADALKQVNSVPPTEAEVQAVATRLEAVGWPAAGLASADQEDEDDEEEDDSPERVNFFQRILDWLREGYPDGVPPTDLPPLFALLQRRLTKKEIKKVAKELIASNKVPGEPKTPISEEEAQEIMQQIAGVVPIEADLDRVRKRLAKKGWPLV